MQQGTPYNLALDEQFILQQDTDTAHPQTPVPIYYIHSIRHPFCHNALCACQQGRKGAARVLGYILEGVYSLHDAQPLIDGIPVQCLTYGHSWQITENPDVKECSLCGIRGYCPGCTPQASHGAQPFYCTFHTLLREVQQ